MRENFKFYSRKISQISNSSAEPAPKVASKDPSGINGKLWKFNYKICIFLNLKISFLADDGYVMTKWRQERIWIEGVEKESKSIKEWEDKWSFLAEYDQKGNVKEKEKLPERATVFSDKLPSTCGQVYGHRLETEEGKLITTMDSALSMGHKRRRNNALICYD